MRQGTKHTTKVARITKERYDRTDHYRAQVQLNEKLVWAICYGSIFDHDSKDAGKLRDALAEAIERVAIEHFRGMIQQAEFRWYFSKWCEENVDESMMGHVSAFLRTHFKEL